MYSLIRNSIVNYCVHHLNFTACASPGSDINDVVEQAVRVETSQIAVRRYAVHPGVMKGFLSTVSYDLPLIHRRSTSI